MKHILRSKITLAAGVGLSGLVLSKCVFDYSQKHGKGGLVHAAKNAMNKNQDENKDDETLTLKSVQVFFRHGARTPLSHLPNIEEVRIFFTSDRCLV